MVNLVAICNKLDLRMNLLFKDLWNIQTLLSQRDGVLQSNEANTVFVKTRSLEELQRKMTDLFECQKKRGALVQNYNS